MEKVWPVDRCNALGAAYQKMQTDARNPRWDYGPQLMALVQDMVEWFAKDTYDTPFYTDNHLFTATPEAIQAFKVVLDKDFYLCLIQCKLHPDLISSPAQPH